MTYVKSQITALQTSNTALSAQVASLQSDLASMTAQRDYYVAQAATSATGGTPFHKISGQSVSGAGVITAVNGNPTIDGVQLSNIYSGYNNQITPVFISFASSASINSGNMSGLLFPSRPTTIGMPARTTSPTIYTNNTGVGSQGGWEQTWNAASIGTNLGYIQHIYWYSTHGGVSGGYPPDSMSWQWWLYVNSVDTGNTDVQIAYGIHQTGSYSRYNISTINGISIYFRGILKLRLRADVGGHDATSFIYATIVGYW